MRDDCSIRRQKVPHYWKLYMQDPFHSVVNMRLSKVLGSLVFAVRHDWWLRFSGSCQLPIGELM